MPGRCGLAQNGRWVHLRQFTVDGRRRRILRSRSLRGSEAPLTTLVAWGPPKRENGREGDDAHTTVVWRRPALPPQVVSSPAR
jgi:hypothetical protein